MLFVLQGVFIFLTTAQLVLVVLPHPLGLTRGCDLLQKGISDATVLDFTPTEILF